MTSRRPTPSWRDHRGSSLPGVYLFREFPECCERARAVHGARSAVHRDGDAERIRDLGFGGSGADGAPSMRSDAAVALLADGDGQRDQLLRLLVQRTGGVCGGVHLAVPGIDVGDRATQRAGRFAELLLDIVGMNHDVIVVVAVPLCASNASIELRI